MNRKVLVALVVGGLLGWALASGKSQVTLAGTKENTCGDLGRLCVGSSLGGDGGRITSEVVHDDGTRVKHGLQLLTDADNRLKEYSVYKSGLLESRWQFYPNGQIFRKQVRSPNGDGYEEVCGKGMVSIGGGEEIKTQETLAHGTIKDGNRWDGTFLMWQFIPNTYGEAKLDIVEFQEGKIVKSTPFSRECFPVSDPMWYTWPLSTGDEPRWPK